MSAHVYESLEAQAWVAKCYDFRWRNTAEKVSRPCFVGPERPHTDAGLTKAFADRDKHNRIEHTNV
jgi:hypothetical protein